MFKHIIGLFSLIALMGFSSTEIHVSEDGIIPDGSIVQAYRYRQDCMDRESSTEAMRNRAVFKSATGQGMSIDAVCQEEMFILFGELSYKVISTDALGRSTVVHTDTTIAGVNAFLQI